MTRLGSGGIIACYSCQAACAHCMYGCSPKLKNDYISGETADNVCRALRGFGCRSVHVGGGEPFTDYDGLVRLIKIIRGCGLDVDYIETNAAWVTGDEKKDYEHIRGVMAAGGGCMMVSADFFHIEFIPFWKVRALINLMGKRGIRHFVWQGRFLHELGRLDPRKTYGRHELIEALGYDAALKCAREYGMGFNGRALNLLRSFGKKYPVEAFLSDAPCASLSGAEHFHADLYGNYVPPGCTGIGLPLGGLAFPAYEERCPAVSALRSGGLRRLYSYAVSRGYIPDEGGYVSKCDLCFSMRKYLVADEAARHPSLAPRWFYEQDY